MAGRLPDGHGLLGDDLTLAKHERPFPPVPKALVGGFEGEPGDEPPVDAAEPHLTADPPEAESANPSPIAAETRGNSLRRRLRTLSDYQHAVRRGSASGHLRDAPTSHPLRPARCSVRGGKPGYSGPFARVGASRSP
jgi:hypothetical protein